MYSYDQPAELTKLWHGPSDQHVPGLHKATYSDTAVR